MSMYPDEQTVKIDGEIVSYPGLVDGKFSSGDFSDPSKKPSFIPAETINLILDNLTALIIACDGAPANNDSGQLVALLSSAATVKKIIQRDGSGRAKIAAPAAADDIARKDTVDTVQSNLNAHAAAGTAHGSTSAATASSIMQRDGSGRAKIAAPSAADDIARKEDARPPIGATYMQFPGKSDPGTLWPDTIWSNISSETLLKGRVPRIEGAATYGSAAAFGSDQDDQGQGHRHDMANQGGGSYSSGNGVTGASNAGYGTFGPNTDGVNGTPRMGTETRAASVTVRIWQRTA